MTADRMGSPLEAFASRWVVALCALTGLFLGLLIYWLTDPTYESLAIVSVNGPLGTMGDEAALVLSDRVLSPAAATLGFFPEVDVEPNEVADLLIITVQANDPDDASRAANQIAHVYVESHSTVASRVADPAEPNPAPIAPNRMAYVLIGSVIGSTVGAAIGSLRSLGKLVPRPTEEAERPTPIRPALVPSSELATALRADAARPDRPIASGHTTVANGHEAGPFTPSTGPISPSKSPFVDLRESTAPEPVSPVASVPADVPFASREPRTTSRPTSVAEPAALSSEHAVSPVPRRAAHAASIPDADPSPRNDSMLNEPPSPDEPPVDSEHRPRQAQAGHPTRFDALQPANDAEAVEARYQTLLADQAISHAETLAVAEAEFERDLTDLKRLLADARTQARTSAAQIKRMSGDDQHRIGDLEAQATALEAEISTVRQQLESERIAHVRDLTTERDAADRALDNARREFRSRIDANENDARRSISDNRAELDQLLAATRLEHQVALDRQHQKYEDALAQERDRHKAETVRLAERHREEVAAAHKQAEDSGARQALQIKQSFADLRASEKRLTTQVHDLNQVERQLRAELTTARNNRRSEQQEHAENTQALRDELALTKKSLQSEKERNAALRDDVVRRTAEAHHAVDQAIEDRSAKLTELEALVARQREHAERRVREANAAAEKRAHAAMRRETELSNRVTKLERELDQLRPTVG